MHMHMHMHASGAPGAWSAVGSRGPSAVQPWAARHETHA